MSRYFLGVDGGGTKSAFVVLDDLGRICGRHEEAGSYHVQIGMDGLRTVLTNGIDAVLQKSALTADDLTHAFFGLPAYGEDNRVTGNLDAMPASILGHARYVCGNDMVCGWAGSLGCEDGINIVAGTGSIGYGECQGRIARAGGWGEIFGDEGSAYWIAVEGFGAFSKMSDGRLPRGPLYDIIRTKFGFTDDLDVSGFFAGGERDALAAVSRLVTQAAAQGDSQAQKIFARAVGELVLLVTAISTALNFDTGTEIMISYSGGVFNAHEWILSPFIQALQAEPRAYRITQPQFDPGIGAALYAAKLVDGDALKMMAARGEDDAP
jgi:N-acetylglucosamine kinase-like BadF-type ATPase